MPRQSRPEIQSLVSNTTRSGPTLLEKVVNQLLALFLADPIPVQAALGGKSPDASPALVHQSFEGIQPRDKRPHHLVLGFGRHLLYPLDNLSF